MIGDRFRRLATAASAVVILLGMSGLLGWLLNVEILKSALPGSPTMKANTAVAFLSGGASLWLQVKPYAAPRTKGVARTFALLTLILGVLTLTEYVLGIDFGIDQLLFRAPAGELQTSSPGRMAPNTALSFALLGMALVSLDARGRAIRLISQGLAVGVLLIAFVALCGYVLDVTTLYGVAGYSSMSLPTAVGFAALSVGVLVSRPDRGMIAVLAQDNRAGAFIRRLAPILTVSPVVVGWLQLRGQQAGLYGPEFGLALVIVVTTSFSAAIALRYAHVEGLADENLKQAARDDRFLFELSESLRLSSDPSDALFQGAKKLGEYLGLSRCFFSQIDVPNDRAIVWRDYHLGLPSLAGTLSLSSYSSESIADAQAGRTLISNDTGTDSKTAALYETAYRPAGIRARVAVPFRKDGQWVASCVASTHEPRMWQPQEVALIEATAERIWFWHEHLAGTEQVRRSEGRLTAIFNSAFDAIVSMDDRGAIVEFNASAERLFGYRLSDVAGRPLADSLVPPRLRQAHRDGLARCLETGEGPLLGKIVELSAMRADGCEFDAAIAITRVDGVSPPLFTGYIRDITESKRAAARFRALIEASAQIVWTTAATGEVIEDSPSWRAFTGQSYDEWRGWGWLDALHPEDRERTAALWKNAVETRTVVETEYRIRHKSGEWRWTAVRAVPLMNDDGSVREWVGMNADITERKRVEESLRESEERFSLFVNALKDHALFFLNPDGTIATWNPGAERLKGYRSEEVIGTHISRFYVSEAQQAGEPAENLEIAAKKGTCEAESWRVRKDGSRFLANVVITALRDADGQLVGFGKITRDMTERVRAREQLRLVIEAAPTGMLMVDAQGTIVLVNAQIEKMFDYTRNELIGQPVEMLVPARFRDRHPRIRAAFLTDPQARPMGAGRDLYGVRKDGVEIPIEIGLNPIHTADGNFVLGSVVDISSRRRADREREELLGQLQELNAGLEARVQSRTAELTSTLKEREVLLQEVHHRVKNNLQVISSLINMQVRQLPGDAGRSALEECQSRVGAIALIHEKLYQSKDYGRVPFPEYTRSLAANLFHAMGISRATITLDVEAESIALPVDKAIPCGLILNELITNALKHAFPGNRCGTIHVGLRRSGRGDLVLSVGDDGIGMPATFDPVKATSLGVPLVYTLAEQLEGQLELTRGKGTTFRITFPLEVP